MDLNLFWFVTLGVLLAGYAILDGFDLGVGILHLAARGDGERRLFMNSIGPLWDGNEVWLVTFGGALFAAFPHAYATAFSGFYLAFMVLLFALIMRAVSMEFRSKHDSAAWRRFFDVAFFLASLLATLLFGVAVGSSMKGIPVGADFEYAGTFLGLLGPFPVLVGLFTVSMFMMHGSIYLYLKTQGDLQQRIHGWMWRAFAAFLAMYVITTVYSVVAIPNATATFRAHPWVWFVVVLNILAIANIPRAIYHQQPFYAFVSSSCSIAAFVFLFGVALYPNLIVSSIDPSYSLTIYNAASSPKTLGIMQLIAFLGMPFVLAYTAVIYWVFRGKVELGRFSY
ncbi:MAG TPA: cytochrome d ubiquinol oxidase subunit II [Phycisphaerae bacterium]|nr:cytochrome d ubiquinol oxidase subunit II [Phycisphaerae bacterium]HNU47061.1 cytochrome d ubiquinol oxidase subunit II [Phycisphaerae bacterium]